MSKECFICGRKLGMMTAKAKTADDKYICADDLNNVFGSRVGNDLNIKLSAATWIANHSSNEIIELLNNGEHAVLSGPDRCITCGNRVPLKFYVTKDNSRVCHDCAAKVFGENSVNVRNWISSNDAIIFKGYFKQNRQLKAKPDGTADGEFLFCPYCNSENVKPLGADRKAFSMGKAAAGAVLTGGIGVLAGFAGKQTGMTDFVCMDCGKQFKR